MVQCEPAAVQVSGRLAVSFAACERKFCQPEPRRSQQPSTTPHTHTPSLQRQNVLRVVAGESLLGDTSADTITLWAVIPLSLFFIVAIWVARKVATVSEGGCSSAQQSYPCHPWQLISFSSIAFQRLVRPWTATDDDAHKFGECFVRVAYYGTMWTVAVYLAEMEGYWPDITQCWVQLRVG